MDLSKCLPPFRCCELGFISFCSFRYIGSDVTNVGMTVLLELFVKLKAVLIAYNSLKASVISSVPITSFID